MFATIYQEIGSARAQPRPGLLGDLVVAECDGRALTDDELANMVFLLILGGMDTTAGLCGNSLLLIDAQPKLRKQILADPSVLDQGTEEFLRYATPTLGLPRTVTKDTEFHGRQLKRVNRYSSCTPRPTAIRTNSTILRRSTYPAKLHVTWHSDSACTGVWDQIWPEPCSRS